METLNEHFMVNEKNMRFEALQQLREIQGNLVGVSFLPVIAVMKEENPMRKDILTFQDKLDQLTIEVQTFISKAKDGADYNSEEETEDEETEEPEEIEDEEKEKDKKSEKVEDSSQPKE